jgi:uncharacterized protein YjbJ (UPF0337 family)
MSLFEFASSIKLEPDPLEVQGDSSKAALGRPNNLRGSPLNAAIPTQILLEKLFGGTGPQTSGGSSMNTEHVSGKAEEIKGKVKEKVGHSTDDPDTEAAGLKDQAKGKVKQAEGDVKEALHKPHKG